MNRRKEEMEKEKLWEIEKEGGDTGRKKGWKRQKRDIYFKKRGGEEDRERRKKGELKRRKKRDRKKQLKRDRDVKQRHVL